MTDYVLNEDSISTLCVTFNKVLENSISVEYSLTNEMMSGKRILVWWYQRVWAASYTQD